FFMLNQDLLPLDAAIAAMKEEIVATYGKRGPEVVERNFNAIERALAAMEQVKVPDTAPPPLPVSLPPELEGATDFVRRTIAVMMSKWRTQHPVSCVTVHPTLPTGKAR